MKKIIFLIGIIINLHGMEQEQTIQPFQPAITFYEAALNNDGHGKPAVRVSIRINGGEEASLYYYNSPSILQKYNSSIFGNYKDQLDKVIIIEDFCGRMVRQDRANPTTTEKCKYLLVQHVCQNLFQRDLKEYLVFFYWHESDCALIQRCGFIKPEGKAFLVLTKPNQNNSNQITLENNWTSFPANNALNINYDSFHF